jgi:hypothetical protein
MRPTLLAAVAVCLVATAACHSAEIRRPNGEYVAASTPRSMSIRRGESAPLQVAIDRENFRGPVTVSISQLPKGVAVDRSSQKVESDAATFALVASKDADLVANQAVAVVIDDMDGRRATQYVTLTVRDRNAAGGD